MSDVDQTLQKFAEEDLKSSARFASLLTGDETRMSDVPTPEELTLASARGVSWNEALGTKPHDYQTYDGEVGTDAEGRTITQYTRHTSRGYGRGEVQNPPGQMVAPGSDDAAKSSDSIVDKIQNSRTGGFSAVSTWDAYRRVTYKAQAVKNSTEYMRKFLELSRSQVVQAKELAQRHLKHAKPCVLLRRIR